MKELYEIEWASKQASEQTIRERGRERDRKGKNSLSIVHDTSEKPHTIAVLRFFRLQCVSVHVCVCVCMPNAYSTGKTEEERKRNHRRKKVQNEMYQPKYVLLFIISNIAPFDLTKLNYEYFARVIKDEKTTPNAWHCRNMDFSFLNIDSTHVVCDKISSFEM